MWFSRTPPGPLQRVPGRVQGIQGESLVLQFNGENRKIAPAKVAGIALASEHEVAEAIARSIKSWRPMAE